MTKVKNIKTVDGHTVCEGELVFIHIEAEDTINGLSFRKDNKKIMVAPMSKKDHKQAQYIKPVVISRTEEIEIGDKVFSVINNKIIGIHTQFDADSVNKSQELFPKILVLPEQFSSEHLESIKSGELKEGAINVKCYQNWTIQLINNKVELFNN